MNIFGEGFHPEIVKQVVARQKAYGSGYASGTSRSPEQILYLNANTAWCKLISSTDITNISILNNETVKQLGLTQDNLAKQFILFNGTADDKGNGLRGGITSQNALNDKIHAYGIGGTSFGIRPMAGIQSVSVTHENRGSLRRAEVKMKAFNKAQFEIIDVLYLRLGFSVLLEWGNSMYFDNNDVLQKNPSGNSLANNFINGKIPYDEFLKKIRDQRIKTQGNYDAMFGKVTNFHWSFLPDGSYDITLNLSSIGDIIESLKTNVSLSLPIQFDTNTPIQDASEEDKLDLNSDASTTIVDAYASKHTIGGFLYFCKIYLLKNGSFDTATPTGLENKSLTIRDANLTPDSRTENDSRLVNFNPLSFDPNNIDAMLMNGISRSQRYYIRLGTFLQFLENYIIPQISNNDGASFIPNLKFDFDEKTNIMNVHPLQVSVDPRICLVNRDITIGDSNYIFGFNKQNFQNQFMNYDLSNLFPNEKDTYYANIMNIYLDFVFIIKKIDELKDDQGNLLLIDFLKGLMSGINEGLGGINDFDVFIDETTNIVKIIDKNPLKHQKEILEYIKTNYPNATILNGGDINVNTSASFDLYGYSTEELDPNNPAYNGLGHSSFIKEFNFATELTPAFSTQITVGAAANGTVIGENDTALSKLNKGLTDRYKPIITNYIDKKAAATNDAYAILVELGKRKKEYFAIRKEYVTYLTKNLSWGTADNPNSILASDDLIDTYKTTLSSLIQAEINIQKLNAKYSTALALSTNPYIATAGTGFIPFNLSLTMDGLSGMKINQQFNINTRFLPSNYPDTVKFLIKNLTHEIKDNKWFTRIESYCIADPEDLEYTTETPPTEFSNPYSYNNASNSNTSTNGTWANKLRADMRRLGISEKGKELDENGDITQQIYEVASGIFDLFRKTYPFVRVDAPNLTITSGNDLEHTFVGYVSKHASGNAIDITVSPSTLDNVDKVLKVINTYKQLNPNNYNLSVLDEYRNPSSASTGGHIHIQVN